MFLFLLPLLSNFMIEKKTFYHNGKYLIFPLKCTLFFLNSFQSTSLSIGLKGAVPKRRSQVLSKEGGKEGVGQVSLLTTQH